MALDNTFATVISMLPYPLIETKTGLYPNSFPIAKAEPNNFTLNIIPNNIYYLINPDPLADAKQTHYIKVPVPAIDCARSIVNDYVSSLIAVDMPERVPGLFAVVGDWSDKKEFQIKHAADLLFYRKAQIGWFENLVRDADDAWSKTHSPVMISDLQKAAAKQLGFARDWINPTPSEMLQKCPICQNPINPGALKCIACQTVLNKAEYERVLATVK
jgi:hypothetical protein